MNDNIVIDSRGKAFRNRNIFYTFSAAVQKARLEIMAQEDAEIFRILDSIANGDST